MEGSKLFFVASLLYVYMYIQSHNVEAAPKRRHRNMLSWKMEYNLCGDQLDDMSQRVCDDKLEEPISG